MDIRKPTLVNVIAWTTLISGIVDLFWGIAASHAALATIIGFVCVPITILPTVLGIFEIVYAAKLLGSAMQPIKPSTNIAVLEIACVLFGNVFTMVVGMLALVFYNDTAVRDYFNLINRTTSGTPAGGSAIVPSAVSPKAGESGATSADKPDAET